MQKNNIRIYLAVPGDVYEESYITGRVLERLAADWAAWGKLDIFYREYEPAQVSSSKPEPPFKPSEADIAVFIAWTRLGPSRKPAKAKSVKSRPQSAFESDLLEVINASRQRGAPDLLYCRKTGQVGLEPVSNPEALMKRTADLKALDALERKCFSGETQAEIKAKYHRFENSAQFEQLLEEQLRRLLKARQTSAGRTVSVKTEPYWTQGSPFRGLENYDFAQAPIFFGRTKAVSEVIALLRRQAGRKKSFLLILGPGGSGKSSLLRAGVLPMLTQPGVIEGVGLWRRAIFRPGDAGGDLLLGLTRALIEPEALPELANKSSHP